MSAKIPNKINEIITQKNSTESLISHLFDSLYLNLPKTPEEIREHNEILLSIMEELEHCNTDCRDLLKDYAQSKEKLSNKAKEILSQLDTPIIPNQPETKQIKPK